MRSRALVAVAALCGCLPGPALAQSLRGSSAAMREQYNQALAHDFTLLRNSSHVQRFVDLKLLVRLGGDANYVVHRGVSFPYARPEVRLFVERLARQYRGACGEQLVVTSLTRPKSRQPRNASSLSVHPTGMAVDLRRSASPACRSWLERVLLGLEERRVIQATRERRPPHYHIAVYPQQYAAYVDRLEDARLARLAAGEPAPRVKRHRVLRGDSLWDIARAYGTTVEQLRAANNLRGSRIYPGQTLDVPANGS